MQDLEPISSSPPSEEQPHPIRHKIISAAANIAIMACLTPTVSWYPGDTPNFIGDDCLTTVSSHYLEETEALLEQPDDSTISDGRAAFTHELFGPASTDMAWLAAQRTDLHITPVDSYVIPLENDAKAGYKQPFSTYLDTAKRYFATYDIVVDDAKPREIMRDSTVSTATPQELETKTAKQDVIDLLQSTSVMPEQYLAFAGLRTVTFGVSSRASAEWNELLPHSMFIDVTDKDSGGNANHEVFHGISNKLCAGDSPHGLNGIKDLQIDTLNTHAYTTNAIPTMTEFYAKQNTMNKQVARGTMTQSQEDTELAQYGARVSFTDPYGATLPSEDAAQIGRFFGVAEARDDLFNPQMPHLRAKAILWLARLRKQAPRLFDYINDIIPPIQKVQ